MAGKKALLARANKLKAAISFYGTPENGYADSGLWLFMKFVKTKDEHDQVNPVKPFPCEEDGSLKEYISRALHHMLVHHRCAFPKSRQIMITWTMAAFCSWFARTAPFRKIIWQSKAERDAFEATSKGNLDRHGGRISFIEATLPGWLQDPKLATAAGNGVGRLVYENDSLILGVPQGGDIVRSHTPTMVIADEAAYQDEFASAWEAAQPAITGGGRIIAASSATPSFFFNEMVYNVDRDEHGEIEEHVIRPQIRGIDTWTTNDSVEVMRIHYTADPDKDPARRGAEWIKQAEMGYVGGMSSAGWQREMEIRHDVGGGTPVFPFMASTSCSVYHTPIPLEDLVKYYTIHMGFDHGLTNPSCAVFWAVDSSGLWYQVDEIYKTGMNHIEMAGLIKSHPLWPYAVTKAADPSIWKNDQSGLDGKTCIADLYESQGVSFERGKRGAAEPVAAMFMSKFWGNLQKPRAFICRNCVNSIREAAGLMWAEHRSAASYEGKNQPEKIRDKDNHSFDATAYMFSLDPRPDYKKPFRPTRRMTFNDAVQASRSATVSGGEFV